MKCQDAVQHILLRSSGEMDEGQKAELADHLAGCEACRAYAADVAGLSQLVRDAAPDAADPLIARVLAACPGRLPVAGRSPWLQHYRWAMLAAAAGLVLCFGIWQVFLGIPVHGVRLEDSPGARIAAVSDFIYVMTHTDNSQALEEGAEVPGPAKDMEALAEQILSTQGLDMDFAAELGEEVNRLEAHLPTTLQWHNNPGLPSGRCG